MVNDFYYPLYSHINYQPIVAVDGIILPPDIDLMLHLLKEEQINAALVGNKPASSQEEYDKMKEDSTKIRKSNICFLSKENWYWLYNKLAPAILNVNVNNFSKVLYGIEPLQYTEYDSNYNGFYGAHIDSELELNRGLKRSLSFSVQLTDEDTYTGGELKIYHNNTTFVAPKQKGVITFFSSDLLHEVTPVTSGFRKSLVGWVIGPRV